MAQVDSRLGVPAATPGCSCCHPHNATGRGRIESAAQQNSRCQQVWQEVERSCAMLDEQRLQIECLDITAAVNEAEAAERESRHSLLPSLSLDSPSLHLPSLPSSGSGSFSPPLEPSAASPCSSTTSCSSSLSSSSIRGSRVNHDDSHRSASSTLVQSIDSAAYNRTDKMERSGRSTASVLWEKLGGRSDTLLGFRSSRKASSATLPFHDSTPPRKSLTIDRNASLGNLQEASRSGSSSRLGGELHSPFHSPFDSAVAIRPRRTASGGGAFHTQTSPSYSQGNGYHQGAASLPHRSQSYQHLAAADSPMHPSRLSAGITPEHQSCGQRGSACAPSQHGVNSTVVHKESMPHGTVRDVVVVRGANPAAVEAYLRLKAQRGQQVHIVKS